eukprot:CAMPEP_0185764640 /NCGR_PEP_ID=MMETSP1174-20130828/23605_1 /TAXON_ID=35687 /ORGANISM="Dictyocha speculum, Strain CCMP1381" /LENGTH=361 /DNA_ID=CAMNT_0028447271 /DNA_START=168 /DNA_END=1253 /DNA_ORIENTATION=+
MTGPLLPLSVDSHYDLPSLIARWLYGKTPIGSPTNAGVVYVALGNMPYLDKMQAQMLVEALSVMSDDTTQFRVLWMAALDQRATLPATLPPNFRAKVLGAVPHLKVLSHESVRAVVSHCGMAGAQEALYLSKPLLCIPFFVDQPDVAARVRALGAGIVLDKNSLRVDVIRESIIDLLLDDKYHKAAAEAAHTLRRAGGLFGAASAVESALDLGTKYLYTRDLEEPWHKAYMVDVLVLYSAGLCLAAVALYMNWLALAALAWLFYQDKGKGGGGGHLGNNKNKPQSGSKEATNQDPKSAQSSPPPPQSEKLESNGGNGVASSDFDGGGGASETSSNNNQCWDGPPSSASAAPGGKRDAEETN